MSSSAPMFLAFLAIHVMAALTAMLSGAGAALARDKGRGRHTRLGDIYVAAICVVFATGAVMAVMRSAGRAGARGEVAGRLPPSARC